MLWDLQPFKQVVIPRLSPRVRIGKGEENKKGKPKEPRRTFALIKLESGPALPAPLQKHSFHLPSNMKDEMVALR